MKQLGDRMKTSTKSCRSQGKRPKSPALVDGKQGRQLDKKIVAEEVRAIPRTEGAVVVRSTSNYWIERDEPFSNRIQFVLYLTSRRMQVANADIERSGLGTRPWQVDVSCPALCGLSPEATAVFAEGLVVLAEFATREFETVRRNVDQNEK